MEKDKVNPKVQQKAAEKEGTHEDIWVSAFDSKVTPILPPPAIQLTANPAQDNPPGGGHAKGNGNGEPEDYEPETLVFDNGGFADPQDPKAGDAGKGIKVTIPPDLDGPTALVHVVMAMMRLTESEARTMIVDEAIQWVDYHPNGHGKDRKGNAVHLMRFKPKYSERTAHEPETLRPTEGSDLMAYNQFKLYLQDHDCDNIRDPYEQYDRMAREQGWYPVETPQIAYGIPGGGSVQPDNSETEGYHATRKTIVEFVVWERLRAKRESLAKDIPTQKTGIKATVEQMADCIPSLVDMELLKAKIPKCCYEVWVETHVLVIQAQAKVEQGDASAFTPELMAKLYELANLMHEFTSDMLSVWGDGFQVQRFDPFNGDDFKELQRLVNSKEFGIEEGRQLVSRYYDLSFTVLGAIGTWVADEAEMKGGGAKDGDNAAIAGKRMQGYAKAGKAALGVMANHPEAQKVYATFYPEKETKDFRQDGENQGGDDWSEGMELEIYLWHDGEAGEWVLEDFSDIEEHKSNRVKGAEGDPVPVALFAQLNSKLRFPKGALFYRCPNEGSYRIMRTTEPTTMADWLRWTAIAGLAIGMAVATAGASIPAQVIMIVSALAMATAEGFDMAAESEQGMLTSERVMVHSALIASCVLGSASGALSMAGKAVQFGANAAKVVRVVAGMQVAADGVCVAVFTTEAFEGLKAAADDPEGVTFTRLLGFFLQMGMNGLMLYGIKGSMLEAKGAKDLGELHGGVKGPTKDRAATVEALKGKKTTLNEEFSNYWKQEGIEGFVPIVSMDMNTMGALGSLPKGISVPNYRRLFGILSKMAKNGIELTVESVLLRLEKIGMRVRDLMATERGIIELCIQDVKRADMTAEEIAFADSYLMFNESSELSNYELRALYQKGCTIHPETGALVPPVGREVDFSHFMLSPELRTKLIKFEKRIDFSAHPDLVELARLRQEQRELVARIRNEIKARRAAGETISETEMAAFNKKASEIGVMSEDIAEKSLQKYLDGEGFIQVYPADGAASSKSGDFDRIYMKQDGDRFQVFEVKGGVSPIGDRLINNVEGITKGSVAQQGTLPYLKQIIHDMMQKPHSKVMAENLEFALRDDLVDYLSYRQSFSQNGELLQPEIGQFDIRENGVNH